MRPKGPQTWIIATGMLTLCSGVIFIFKHEFDFQPRFRVWGHVTFNGRAMARGTIAFAAFGDDPRTWISVPLDEQGRYSIDIWWIQSESESLRVPVSIFPHGWRAKQRDEAPSRVADLGASDEVSSPRGPAALEPRATDDWYPERLTHPRTSGLEVTLTGEPTRIDFHLESGPPPLAHTLSSNARAAPNRAGP